MYSITIDGNLIYRANAIDIGYVVESATLDEAINEPSTLTVTVPTTNPNYKNWLLLKSLVIVTDDDESIIFRGRIKNIDYDFYNSAVLECESDLAYLYDTDFPAVNLTQPVTNWFISFIRHHNNIMTSTSGDFSGQSADAYKTFTLGDIDTAFAEETITIETDDPVNLFELIEEYFIDELDARIEIRHHLGNNYVDLKSREFDPLQPVTVEYQNVVFGQNLIDFSKFIDVSEVITVLMPLGKKNENDVRLRMQGKDYLFRNVDTYGRIFRTVIFDDIESQAKLESKGNKYLKAHAVQKLTLDISAIDLSVLNVDTDKFKLGEYHRVISEPHGVNDMFELTTTERDLMDPSNDRFAFGAVVNKITDTVSKLNKQKKEMR